MEYSCLIVQKDTLEDDKVKAVLKVCHENPEDFLSKLQESHCIQYQLIAYCKTNPEMMERLSVIVKQYKTNYGTDWYEFDHDALANIISLYIEYDMMYINVQSIADIMGFSFNMFPVVTKEIKVSTIPNVPVRVHKEPVISMPKEKEEEEPIVPIKEEAVPIKNKKEILEEIIELERSGVHKKKDRHHKREKRERK